MRSIWKLTLTLIAIAILHTTSLAASTVTVSPSSVQLKPGAQVQFSATVAGDSTDIVIWSVSGAGCSGISCGMIDSNGLYTAPAVAPSPAIVTVTAESLFDPSMTGTATVNLGQTVPVAVSISPTSLTIAVKGTQQFHATVTGTANTAVTWTVSGTGCVSTSCGTISTTGLYTAPATVPNPAIATVTATSVADPTKHASASVVIKTTITTVTVSQSAAQLTVGKQKQFAATVTGVSNTAVTWSVSGTGCSGAACGTISSTGLYTAPANVPASPTVTVKATSVGDPTTSGTATVTVVSASPLTISPSSPSVNTNGQVQFTPTLQGSTSVLVTWSVSGSGCSGLTCGSITSTGLYTAPAAAPNPPMVTVTATLLSNPAISASATVTIAGKTNVTVSISPTDVSVAVGNSQQFHATVLGTNNTAVTWSVNGLTCGGADCGTITAAGLYTAPLVVPNPSFVNVVATSVADPTKSASTTVTITPQVGVHISPTTATVPVTGTQQFKATVTGFNVTGVTWSVSGAKCSGAACGTINANGLYTAPATPPSPPQVTVTATAVADGKTSASAIVTIFVPIVVTISPTSADVTVSQQQQFRASATGTTNTNFTWTLSGAGCSGATCGTISSTGLYTAPAVVPSPATVSVKAASQADLTKAAIATVHIIPSNLSKLMGQYVIQFTGSDTNGVYQAAAVFTADGNGKVLAGLADTNSTTGPKTSVAFTGTYSVGSDNRGLLNIAGTWAHTFAFALNPTTTKGRLIVFDHSGVRGSGVIEKRDPTAIDPSALTGGYVLNLTGQNVFGQRTTALGIIFPDGSSFISGASLDANEGGVLSPTFGSFGGTYNVASTGRGTMSLSIPGFDGGTFNFALYVVSANEFFMVSTDPGTINNPIFSGPAELQSGAPFLSSSFLGGSVFDLSGIRGSFPEDTVGRLGFDGTHNVKVNFDQNSAGNVTVGGTLTGAYDIQLNGRGTLNLVDPSTGAVTIWFLYAIAPNEAFLMDSSSGSVATGKVMPQTSVQPFGNDAALGTYLLGSGEPVIATTPLHSGEVNYDGSSSLLGLGNATGTEDSDLSGILAASQVLKGTYSVSGVSNNGRGALLLTSPTAQTIALWVASPTYIVGLNIDAVTPQPVILHYEQ